jgi:DNA-binding transcriptional LysR family regulator
VKNLDFTSLRLFAVVVEHGNIAQASRVNGIAASAISKRISDLEDQIGVRLIHRLRDGIEPTAAGQELYKYVLEIGLTVERLQASLSEFTKGERGRIRLWANTSAVTQFLPEDLKVYVDQRPGVLIDLREDTSARIADAVRDGIADLGIFSAHIGEPDFERRVYRRDTLMVIAPVGHVLEGKDTVTIRDIAPFDHVGLQSGSSLQARVLEAARESNLEIHMRVQVFGFDGVRRMVEAGLGIAVLPQGAVFPYLDHRNLIAMVLDELWANRTLYLGYRDYRALSLAARQLVETLAPALDLDKKQQKRG